LRRQANPNLPLAKATQAMYEAYRQKVQFVAQDRVFTLDIEASTEFVANC